MFAIYATGGGFCYFMSLLLLIFIGPHSHVTFYFFLGSDSCVIGMCSICATGGQYQAPVITNSMHCRKEKHEKKFETIVFLLKSHQENFTWVMNYVFVSLST